MISIDWNIFLKINVNLKQKLIDDTLIQLPNSFCKTDISAVVCRCDFPVGDGLYTSVNSCAVPSFTLENASISSSDSGASPLNTVPPSLASSPYCVWTRE